MGTRIDSVGVARTALHMLTLPTTPRGQRVRVLAALTADGAARVVELAAAAMVRKAGDDVLGPGRWQPDDVVRLAKRDRRLDKHAEELVRQAVDPSSAPVDVFVPHDEVLGRIAVFAVVAALGFLRGLPALPHLVAPPPTLDDPEQARMLEKVRALLAKAESTTFDEEADAFTAKAQELMARYAIDEALLEAEGGGAALGAGGMRIGIDDPYAAPKSVLLAVIARENRCLAVWSEALSISTVFGAHADLRSVEVLYTSLLVQAVAAMRRAGASTDVNGRSRTRSFRHSFVLAFAERIGERLRGANEAAHAAAREQSGDAFLPVLASRIGAAKQARDQVFTDLRKATMSISNDAGYFAGRAAADTATIEHGAPLPGR